MEVLAPDGDLAPAHPLGNGQPAVAQVVEQPVDQVPPHADLGLLAASHRALAQEVSRIAAMLSQTQGVFHPLNDRVEVCQETFLAQESVLLEEVTQRDLVDPDRWRVQMMISAAQREELCARLKDFFWKAVDEGRSQARGAARDFVELHANLRTIRSSMDEVAREYNNTGRVDMSPIRALNAPGSLWDRCWQLRTKHEHGVEAASVFARHIEVRGIPQRYAAAYEAMLEFLHERMLRQGSKDGRDRRSPDKGQRQQSRWWWWRRRGCGESGARALRHQAARSSETLHQRHRHCGPGRRSPAGRGGNRNEPVGPVGEERTRCKGSPRESGGSQSRPTAFQPTESGAREGVGDDQALPGHVCRSVEERRRSRTSSPRVFAARYVGNTLREWGSADSTGGEYARRRVRSAPPRTRYVQDSTRSFALRTETESLSGVVATPGTLSDSVRAVEVECGTTAGTRGGAALQHRDGAADTAVRREPRQRTTEWHGGRSAGARSRASRELVREGVGTGYAGPIEGVAVAREEAGVTAENGDGLQARRRSAFVFVNEDEGERSLPVTEAFTAPPNRCGGCPGTSFSGRGTSPWNILHELTDYYLGVTGVKMPGERVDRKEALETWPCDSFTTARIDLTLLAEMGRRSGVDEVDCDMFSYIQDAKKFDSLFDAKTRVKFMGDSPQVARHKEHMMKMKILRSCRDGACVVSSPRSSCPNRCVRLRIVSQPTNSSGLCRVLFTYHRWKKSGGWS